MLNLDYAQIATELTQLTREADLNEYKAKFFGKEGVITKSYQQLRQLDSEAKAALGQEINITKQKLENLFQEYKKQLLAAELNAKLTREAIDVTLPARPESTGALHPITATSNQLISILSHLGFQLVDGPELEDDEHNFDSLNIPPLHPARLMHDTFYLDSNVSGATLLRTHTSNVQIRAMRGLKPPFRLMSVGRVYRCDDDQTHTPMFHQFEGIAVGEAVTMAELRYTLSMLINEFFGVGEVPMRFRPSFFPFTEPSAEVDIACRRKGNEITIGAGDQWLEVLGCGMIHPNVLANVGIDPQRYQGFAFGMGVERLAMLKFGIPDLRTFFTGDQRWLSYYGQ